MFTPLVLILVYLSATFVLGLALGWLLWKFGDSKQLEAATTDMQYWKDRLEQSRIEHNLAEDKITLLERERDNLKKRIKSAATSKTQ